VGAQIAAAMDGTGSGEVVDWKRRFK